MIRQDKPKSSDEKKSDGVRTNDGHGAAIGLNNKIGSPARSSEVEAEDVIGNQANILHDTGVFATKTIRSLCFRFDIALQECAIIFAIHTPARIKRTVKRKAAAFTAMRCW